MTKRVKRGSVSKAVHDLCSDTLFGPINESGFKGGLKGIIDDYQSCLGNRGLQNIGQAIQAWLSRYTKDRSERVWRLVDEVDPKVRDEYERWANVFFRSDIKGEVMLTPANVDNFGEQLRACLDQASKGEWGQPFDFWSPDGSDHRVAKCRKYRGGERRGKKNWLQLNGSVYHHPSYASEDSTGICRKWKIQARFKTLPASGIWVKKAPYIHDRTPFEWSLGGKDVWGISYESMHMLLNSYGKERLLEMILSDLRATWQHFSVSMKDKEKVAKFAITLELDEDGFIVASCPALPGCHSQGRTKEEAIANIREAVQGYVASMRKHGEPIPTTEVEEVEVVV